MDFKVRAVDAERYIAILGLQQAHRLQEDMHTLERVQLSEEPEPRPARARGVEDICRRSASIVFELNLVFWNAPVDESPHQELARCKEEVDQFELRLDETLP